jgi:hypothetical protein
MPLAARRSSRQLSIPFDEPVWDHAGLEAALRRAHGRPLRLTLTENRSVLLSYRRKGAFVHLRLHRMFLHAPGDVVTAVVRGIHRTSRTADGTVRRFMNENLHRVRRVPQRMPAIETNGKAHDLCSIYDRLNRRFFDGRLRVPLTWGRGSGRARRGGLTFGSYDPILRLIRIHPVLDRSDVPTMFLESVVYHTRAFREAEARYPHHQASLAWEKENLPRLLRVSQELDRRRRQARRS